MTLKQNGRAFVATLLGGASLFAAGAVLAHGGVDQDQPNLSALSSKAPLIFWGDVADISYRNSEPTEEEPNGVPHTFVTYKVRETLRGKVNGGQVTLRFIGGADGRGGVYTETTTPVFARGQSDILFVKGGALDDCPLVECEDGRFRVAENGVHNAWGVPVVEARKNLVIGGRPNLSLLKMELPRPSFDALAARPEMRELIAKQFANMPADELRKRYEAEAPKFTYVSYGVSSDHGTPEKGAKSPPIRKFGPPMGTSDFLGAVKEAIASAPAQGTVQFADPQAPIRVAPPKAQSFQAASEEIKRNDLELRELRSVKEEGVVKPLDRIQRGVEKGAGAIKPDNQEPKDDTNANEGDDQ